ncbi:MAG TPA: efflux RND transporter periplasmic adaptor subunit [Candidatus Kapabacteria bacterium]|nr:efflux RND transporter periplasmic adaptor subunit [Candidatus Kapabacteria bacterium]
MTIRSRRFLIAGIALAVLAALAVPKLITLFGSGAPRASGGGGGEGARKGAAGPVIVTAYVVRPSDAVDRVSITGTISPSEQVDIQSEIPGKIVKIYFREGTVVHRGMLLVKINDSELQAQLQRAQAHKELADMKEARQRTMREKDAVSQAEYDEALSDMKSAAADIELLKAQIAKTEIRAPFSGTIGLRSVSEGSYISPATRIATLTNMSPAKIDFSVPERYARLVGNGSTINFTVQGITRTFTARVYATEPRIDQQTRTLDVRATCPNPGNELRAGAFAEVSLELSRRPGALMIPSEAVIPDANGAKVFVAKDGAAQPRPINLGLRTERQVEVVKGLADGDTVVATGILQVRPGSRLKISSIQKL